MVSSKSKSSKEVRKSRPVNEKVRKTSFMHEQDGIKHRPLLHANYPILPTRYPP